MRNIQKKTGTEMPNQQNQSSILSWG